MNIRNRAVAVGLTAALTFSTCVPFAYATPQADLAQASSQLETLGDELTSLQDDLATKTGELEETSYRIGEKEAQITQTTAELKEAKKVLSNRMRSSYKSGASSIIEVFLGATSLDDIISRIYYMDKIASNDADTINEVRQLEERLKGERDDLEQTKQSQQEAVEELQTQVDEYAVKVAEAQRYYESLDAQVQAQLAAEENARIQTAVTAATTPVAPAVAQTEEEATPTVVDQPAETEQNDVVENDTSDEEENSSTTSTGGGISYGPAGGGLGTAYSLVGSPYVYGATGPDSFDCSGLVCYCYGYSRGRDTYSMIASLQSTGSWKTSMSDLAVGDLVFTSEGHVGIYAGDGMMVHAPSPGRSVEVASVYAFIGGGTY